MYHIACNMPSNFKLNLGLLALPLLLSGCHATPNNASAGAEWDSYLSGYLEGYFAAHPDVAVSAGRHEFDGKLQDFSKEAIDREIARLHAERDRADAFGNGLNDTKKFERDYLVASIDSDLFSVALPQPILLRRPCRSQCLPDPALRASRATHAGLRRLRARSASTASSGTGESSDSNAAQLRRSGPSYIRRPREIL
jgi:hypothetical protein